jgi:hypothetical protein
MAAEWELSCRSYLLSEGREENVQIAAPLYVIMIQVLSAIRG